MRSSIAALLFCVITSPSGAAVLYDNLSVTNLIGVASQTTGLSPEAADDFVLVNESTITSASFVGLIQAGVGAPSVTGVTLGFYRVFPFDSDTVRTPQVPTRANSPSDILYENRTSASGDLSFSTSTLAISFTSLNSIAPGGIHPSPNVTTGGNGAVTGTEVRFDVNFVTPLTLPADHYFMVAQVTLSNGGTFFWLSAPKPIVPPGTAFSPDLVAWTRDSGLAPDWLRLGDIVGGSPAPTYNLAFSLNGTEGSGVPEPGSAWLISGGLAWIAARKVRKS